MRFCTFLQENDPESLHLAESAARRIADQCARQGTAIEHSCAVVSWSGGKDSTTALLILSAVAEMTGCQVYAYTMYQPGITSGVIANIERIRNELEIPHHFWHFDRIVNAPFDDCKADWLDLYRMLWNVLRPYPRFMCVACNFGALITEYAVLSARSPMFHVTGNPGWEMDAFEEWIQELQAELGHAVKFPLTTGNLMIDYYRVWLALYQELVKELARANHRLPTDATMFRIPEAPDVSHAVSKVVPICVLGQDTSTQTNRNRQRLLNKLGWTLPADIPGSTESDCAYPAAIATINIRNIGLAGHLKQLDQIASRFAPTDEMLSRARDWIATGRSEQEGNRMLDEMLIDHTPSALSSAPGASEMAPSPVARALASKLFPIR